MAEKLIAVPQSTFRNLVKFRERVLALHEKWYDDDEGEWYGEVVSTDHEFSMKVDMLIFDYCEAEAIEAAEAFEAEEEKIGQANELLRDLVAE
tara:strand:+ start:735 stop:1013 length:279 start_codon:yes stop_codon:yes gene_type:complete